jgi:hypothetical protein
MCFFCQSFWRNCLYSAPVFSDEKADLAMIAKKAHPLRNEWQGVLPARKGHKTRHDTHKS